MKIQYDKIKGKAIIPLNSYNLHVLILSFIHDGKLPITEDDIYGEDKDNYDKWCNYVDRIRRKMHESGKRFAIALDPTNPEGCVYGDYDQLYLLGYDSISLTESCDELPNLCLITGTTPNQTLESAGKMRPNKYSPHRIDIDGVIRSYNDGCLDINELMTLLRDCGFITEENNGLYELFGLTPEDNFSIKGHTYSQVSAGDNMQELLDKCKYNHGLMYELINNPEVIQKVEPEINATPKTLNLN